MTSPARVDDSRLRCEGVSRSSRGGASFAAMVLLVLLGGGAAHGALNCTCGFPCDVALSNQTIDTAATFDACLTISTGVDLVLESPADVLLRSGEKVSFASDFVVGEGAILRVQIDVGLFCDLGADADEDTFSACLDCNELDEFIFPGAAEVCDGDDNNCNGLIDDAPVDGSSWYPDVDEDGYGADEGEVVACSQPLGYIAAGGDCNDDNDLINPGAADPIAPDFIDQNCDGTDGVASDCVYVSDSLGHPAGDGSAGAPFDTISAAIAAAVVAGKSSVCVAGGLYGESVTMVSGISVYGGFDDTAGFVRTGVATEVSAFGTVFLASEIDDETHLEGLQIDAGTPVAAGGSAYGVRLTGGTGTLYVRYNTIEAAAGQDGDDGGNGTAHANATATIGNNGNDGCAGSSTCTANGLPGGKGGVAPTCTEPGGKGGDGGFDTGDGVSGSVGTANATVGAGASSVVCFGGPGSPGGNGGSGSAGAQGTQGGGGDDLGTVSVGLYDPADGGDGTTGANGKGGSGGGGGGGGETSGFCTPDRGGGGGSGGCGGLGGNLGQSGKGGGGSFGVFAAAGTVVVTANAIQSASGGDGGKGGNGTAGQNGGSGGTGGADSDDSTPGGPGGNGTNGGAGGPGGGGGGGPSACLARSAAAIHTFSANTCTTGTPGFGGQGGTNPQAGVGGTGSNGLAAQNLQID